MPAKRELTMRQIRQMLRLARDGVSAREIGRTLGVARSTIQDNLKRASTAGLAWPLAGDLTDVPWNDATTIIVTSQLPVDRWYEIRFSAFRPNRRRLGVYNDGFP